MIRLAAQAPAPTAVVREAMNGVDAAVSVSSIVSIDEQMAPLTAQERITARLAVIFGAVALTLAAIGLYGVLSYSISRRSSEIAIRIALGARSGRVIAMILRETTGLVAAGLVIGGALAYVAADLIANRLYGVVPQDVLTLTVATAVLLAVALVAAYVPARRASKVDPMAALHQG